MVGVIPPFFYRRRAARTERRFTVFMVSGVSVMKGQEEIHIRAPMVISNAGIFNTYQKLLPKELQTMPGQEEVYF